MIISNDYDVTVFKKKSGESILINMREDVFKLQTDLIWEIKFMSKISPLVWIVI